MTQATKTSAGRAARGLSPAMPGTATFTRRQRRRNLLIQLRGHGGPARMPGG
jgi:hypothetical protein